MHLFFIEMLATSISRFFDVDQRLPRSCLKLAGPRSRRARWSSPPFDRCGNRGSVVKLSFRFNARGARTRSSRFNSSLPPPGHTPRSRRAPRPTPRAAESVTSAVGRKKKKNIFVYKEEAAGSRMPATHVSKPVVPSQSLVYQLRKMRGFCFCLIDVIGNEDGFLCVPVSCDGGFSCHTVASAPGCALQPPRRRHPSSSGHVLRPHAWTDVTPRAERQDPDSPGPGARLLMRQQRWRKEQRPSAQ